MYRALTECVVTGRAVKHKLLEVICVNPRDFAYYKHQKVDERPFGGGPGMLMMVQPLRDAILHAKKLPKINSYLFYIPRGIVVDYHNDEHLELFTKDLYQYGKEHRAYSIRIDPEIPAYIDGELNPLIKKLKSFGYKHLGLVNNFEGTQPRCTIINDFANKTYEEVYSNYEKRCQKHITNALHNGITIVKSSVDDLDDFMEIMNDTASRGGYITRTREYFEILLKAYQEHMKMYFAYFDPKKID